MSRFHRISVSFLAAMLLVLALSGTALAAGGSNTGGSASGGGSGTGGGASGGGGNSAGGGTATPCGAVTLSASSSTSYYQIFNGTATNCTSTTLDYVVVLSDVSTHANAACAFAPTSNRKASLAPGTISYSYFQPLPCYDDYTIQAQLTLNRQVAGTATISLTNTPTGIIVH